MNTNDLDTARPLASGARSIYCVAAYAAERAKRFAQVPGTERTAYAARAAFRAVRYYHPQLPAWDALDISRSAARANTAAYFPA
jgi:hypothetical protein